MWYIYILECLDGALYVGSTNDIERRFTEHISENGGHYTSYSKPMRILYEESFDTRSQAEKREQQIKRWSREKKLALIFGDFEKLKYLSKSHD